MTSDNTPERGKPRLGRWHRELGAFAVLLGLAVVGVLASPPWLLATSVSVGVGSLLAIAVNTRAVPKPYRGLRKMMGRAVKQSSTHPILARYHDDEIARISKELNDLARGRFSLDVWRVPELSVFAMQMVDRRCILMFPLQNSETLLTPRTGTAAEYYEAMVAASARMRAGGSPSVVRVFLLTRTDEISPDLLDFMERNAADGIDARLLFQEELPPRPSEVDQLDFGYYETIDGHTWVMFLRAIAELETHDVVNYATETDPVLISSYRTYAEAIVDRSKSIQELRTLVSEPMNGSLWPTFLAERGFELPPPHGLSDEDADDIVGSVVRSVTDPEHSAVLVLGFTPKLLRRLLTQDFQRVDSLDQFSSKPPEFAGRVTFLTGNWLSAGISTQYDCIVFDEALNNLSPLQLGLFFPGMKKMLKPGGHFIGRVFGRFDDDVARRYTKLAPWQAVEKLRTLPGESHEDYASIIVCLLHSKHLAFSEPTGIIDCGRWNATLASMHDSSQISDAEYSRWRLPFSFKILSLDMDGLIRESTKAGFAPSEIRPVQGTYVDGQTDARDFYRIVNLESTDLDSRYRSAIS